MVDDARLTLTVVIPTYQRGEALVATLRDLAALAEPADELVVVDQTPAHLAAVETELSELEQTGVRRIRLDRPSIPKAMNAGLLAAQGEIVLFLDDDVSPCGELVERHRAAHRDLDRMIVVGQVLQPGEEPEPLTGSRFAFRSTLRQTVDSFIGCNFSVRRDFLLDLGGFDESFRGAAYRYEAEVAARVRAAGGQVLFEPQAAIRHLRAPRGGTRRHGSHLRTLRPDHAVGEYYFLLRARPPGWVRSALKRLGSAAMTRHHLKRPWWIPATWIAELGGMAWAASLAARAPRLLPGANRSARKR